MIGRSMGGAWSLLAKGGVAGLGLRGEAALNWLAVWLWLGRERRKWEAMRESLRK